MQNTQEENEAYDRWSGRDRDTELGHVPEELKAIAEKLEKPDEFLDDFMDATWRAWDVADKLMDAVLQLIPLDNRIREELEGLMVKKVFEDMAYAFLCYEASDPPMISQEWGDPNYDAVDYQCDRVEGLAEHIHFRIRDMIPDL